MNTDKSVEIVVNGRAGRGMQGWVRKKLGEAAPLLPRNRLQEVVVTFVGDSVMSGLHAKSHNDPRPTDVLTYEVDHDEEGKVMEGQVVVCVPEARRRIGGGRRVGARSGSMGVREEVLLYALHGCLHLCGLDDQTDREFERMHRLEDQILGKIGVGAVFKRGSGART